MDNNKTSERLMIDGNDQPFESVTIARYPMQATEEFIEKMGNYPTNAYRLIVLDI
jgi:hypothetical protein